jgi:hypothetical protein
MPCLTNTINRPKSGPHRVDIEFIAGKSWNMPVIQHPLRGKFVVTKKLVITPPTSAARVAKDFAGSFWVGTAGDVKGPFNQVPASRK